MLRGAVLDWGFARAIDPVTGHPGDLCTPTSTTVCKPYLEGTFLNEGD